MNLYESVTSNLKDSAEDVDKFWGKGFKVGDKVQTSGAGEVEIIDMNKDADYILIKRPTGYQPYVAAWAPSFDENKKAIYWGQGHYFNTEEDAKEFFNSKLNDSEAVEECSVKEGEYEDIYGEPADYTEMRADITALRSICEKAKADGFNFADKFEQAINTLSDICADLEDFYESTSKEV